MDQHIKDQHAQMQKMQQQMQQQQQAAQQAVQQAAQQQQSAAGAGGADPKELEKVRGELQAACTERDRFQQQLELLVTELEKSKVTYPWHQTNI